MNTIVLTCVSCGSIEEVPDTAEAKRNRKCKECGSPMVEKRRPGDTSNIPTDQ